MKNKSKKQYLAIVLAIGIIFTGTQNADIGKYIRPSVFVDFSIEQSRKISMVSNIEEDLLTARNVLRGCDVVVVGGGASGTAAAIQSGRMGVKTCIIEQTDWLGDMLTASGVSAIDGDPAKTSGIFREFLDRVIDYYKKEGKSAQTHLCHVSPFCYEPSVGAAILNEMVSEVPTLKVYYNSYVTKVYREGNLIRGVKFKNNKGGDYVVPAHVVVDATQFGDLMYMANIPYDIGVDKNSTEFHADITSQCIQPLTFVAVLEFKGKDVTIPEPKNYNINNYKCTIPNKLCPGSSSQFDMERLLEYGHLPNDKMMINVPSHSYGNDYDAASEDLDNFSRADIFQKAKDYSLGYIYFMQKELGFNYYGLSNEFGTNDKLAKLPYVRESRRLVGQYRLQEEDVLPDSDGRSKIFSDSIAIGDYPIDLHFCERGKGDFYYPIPPYQIPYGVTVPKEIDGFLVAGQNISVSHIVNGTTRMQPVVMQLGQAVGMASALSVINDVQPRNVPILELQEKLINAGSKVLYFSDINTDSFSYPYVTKLALKNILRGYSDFSFKPNVAINNYDMTMMFAKASAITEYQQFSENTTFEYEDALALLKEKNIIDDSLDISKVEKPVTREELAHVISRFVDPTGKHTASSKNFTDVTKKSRFQADISKLASLDIVSSKHNKFRPGDVATRAEAVTMLGKAMEYSSSL